MNLIFDFDGTICDSFDITIQIANEYLIKHNQKPIDPKEYREKGIEEIVKRYKITKLQILFYIFKSRRELSKHIHQLKTFPGMSKIIKELSNGNILGIVSSNSKKNIETFWELNDMENIFEFIISSPTLFDKSRRINAAVRKYKLNRTETIYIGDEPRDILAARKAKVKSVAVTWGFADKKLLKKFNPDYLIRSLKELLLLEKRLLH